MKRPTGLEMKMMQLIEKYSLPYIYSGDDSFIIGNKNPDFVNINGEKICIEVRSVDVTKYLGNLSPESYEHQRVTHFARYGWKCLVFFADRKNNFLLDENKIIGRLKCV